MKQIVSFIGLSMLLISGCKSKQQINTINTEEKKTAQTNIKTVGRVSHRNRETGCNTVIIVQNKDNTDSLMLIPRLLLNEFDVDKMEIYFDYRILRMPNPKGCKEGVPVEVSNVSKK
jgi:hypothetical protein